MALETAGVVAPKALDGLGEIFAKFERSAVRSKWNHASKGVSTPDKDAEDVKSMSRELRKALVDTGQIEANEDRTGAIVRAEGPCAISMQHNSHVITVAVHGGGELPTVGGVSLPEQTIVHMLGGDINVCQETTAYLLLLGK